MRNKSLACLVIAAAALTLMTGCVRRTAPVAKAPVATDAATSAVAFLGKSFVVAPFSNPSTDADLLSGFLPTSRFVPEMALPRLDAALAEDLAGSKQNILPAKMASGCVKSASRGTESGRLATRRFWQNVGNCAGADYVVVPMLINWHERDGSEMGATSPASVNLSLYLVDAHTGAVLKHFHFDETQHSLASNILDARKFVSRNGRWLSAMELAEEGIKQGIAELGL